MKIVKLQAENFKRLIAVEINPDGSSVILSGKNAQGKSSIIDAIIAALGGGSVQPKKPIRDGEEKATVVIETEEYTIKKVWTHKGNRLVITMNNGTKVTNPQSFLDNLLSKLTFDPTSFMKLAPKAQREYLLNIIDMPINLDELDNQIKNTEEIRRDIGRDLKKEESIVKSFDDSITSLKDVTTDIKKIKQELEKAKVHNELIKDNKYILATLQNEIDALKEEIDKLNKQMSDKIDNLEYERKKAKELGDIIDLDQFIDKIEVANKYNEYISAKTRYDETKSKYNEINANLEALRNKKIDIVQNAKFPVEGLSIDDNNVLYNNIPISDISASEQLKVSVKIAMALNPKLKVLLIKDASLLDSDSLKELTKMAELKDYQAWIEIVDTNENIGFVIEDGQIVSDENTRKMEQ